VQLNHSLVIRGDKDDNAVLCTENKTYELKDTETSNSLLIMKTLKFPKDVTSLQGSSNVDRIVEVQIVTYHSFSTLLSWNNNSIFPG
jgi:Sister chromatid cohesion protein Dcc1